MKLQYRHITLELCRSQIRRMIRAGLQPLLSTVCIVCHSISQFSPRTHDNRIFHRTNIRLSNISLLLFLVVVMPVLPTANAIIGTSHRLLQDSFIYEPLSTTEQPPPFSANDLFRLRRPRPSSIPTTSAAGGGQERQDTLASLDSDGGEKSAVDQMSLPESNQKTLEENDDNIDTVRQISGVNELAPPSSSKTSSKPMPSSSSSSAVETDSERKCRLDKFARFSFEPSNSTSNTTQLLDQLLHNYDARLRPNFGDKPVLVEVFIAVNSMDVDDVLMEYSVDCYFRQTWVDERLEYPIELGGPQISVAASMLYRIWRPDSFFFNGRKSYLHQITVPNRFLRIAHDGTVLYSSRLTIKAVCPMNLRKYPMDKQTCELVIGSFAYTIADLVYDWKVDKGPISVRHDLQMAQYDTPELSHDKTFIISPLHNANVSRLHVHFTFERRMGFFLLELYVPCCLIVVLSWVSFWIDYKATNARVILGMTTVLTMSTLGFSNRGSNAPRVSYATAVDYFVVTCFGFVFAALIEYAGVNYFHLLRLKRSGGIKGPVNEDGFPIEDDRLQPDNDDSQQHSGNDNRENSQRHRPPATEDTNNERGSSFRLLPSQRASVRQRQLSGSAASTRADADFSFPERAASACSGTTHSFIGQQSFNSYENNEENSEVSNNAPTTSAAIIAGPSSKSSFGYYHAGSSTATANQASFRRPVKFAAPCEPALPNVRQAHRLGGSVRSRELTDAGFAGSGGVDILSETDQLVRSDPNTINTDDPISNATVTTARTPELMPSEGNFSQQQQQQRRGLSFAFATASPPLATARRQHTSFQLDNQQGSPQHRQPNSKRSKRRWQSFASIRRVTLRRPTALFKPRIKKMVVSKIDAWARRIFPPTFLVLQIIFWISYKFIIEDAPAQ